MTFADLTTERLSLTAVSQDDLAELHVLYADPRVWQHLPVGVHVDEQQTRDEIDVYAADWARDGLGYWTARRRDHGDLVGIGGVRRKPSGAWNLYFRIAAEHHGLGYASEIARQGLAAATVMDAEAPVVAYLLEHNVASRRTTERLGLTQVWSGPDRDVPGGIRLVYADRAVPAATLESLR